MVNAVTIGQFLRSRLVPIELVERSIDGERHRFIACSGSAAPSSERKPLQNNVTGS